MRNVWVVSRACGGGSFITERMRERRSEAGTKVVRIRARMLTTRANWGIRESVYQCKREYQ